jgi:hypothetical protein
MRATSISCHARRTIQILLAPTGGWKRQGAALFAALVLAGGIALAEGKPDTRGMAVHAIAVDARPLAGFDKSNPALSRFGRLEWRGGLVLTSSSRHFGGWSGLSIEADGRRVLAVSDAGTWLSGELTYRGRQVAGIAITRIGPLLGIDKKALSRERDRDAEAIDLIEGNTAKGTALIAFEGNDRIGRFSVGAAGIGAPSTYLSVPPEVKKIRSADGFEAVAVLRDGPFKGAVVAFAEHILPNERSHSGFIWTSAGHKRFSLNDIGGFDITDAVGLPNGSIVVLERRFRWTEGVKMRLRLLDVADIKPGAKLQGETLIEADLNQEIDNMEGLAAHPGIDGETILTLVSDDNFNPFLQRTLLLQFALPGRTVAVR